VNVTVGVSNANPLVDSSVNVTATVTDNGNPVPNGTAVEFRTTAGVLDGGATSIVKTTTNGIATATLTSSTVGTARVTVTVNNVAKQADVNFVARPVVPVPPNTTPTIISVNPTLGKPAGGETIRITGTNFKAPVRVLFRFAGQAVPTEVTVISSTETTIDVITPGVNLGAGQQLIADIIVITQAGTTTENRAELTGAVTFRSERLTPVLFSITPNSGPVTGGTRVTLVGEAFQEPVQVLFDTAEARVLNVKYGEILVETPAGRDTAPDGSGPVLGPVNVTVRNLNSQTSSTLTAGFNYKNAMQIIAVSPGVAIAGVGGTKVTIDGNGFVGPVVVVVRTAQGDIGFQPIGVTGTRITATAPAILPRSCTDVVGPLVVTNIVNGDQAIGPNFTFVVPEPIVANVNPSSVTAGGNVTVTVINALPGATRLTLGTRAVFPTSSTFDETTRTATFTIAVPTDFEFPTVPCTSGGVTGERFTSLRVDVGYENVSTGCSDTATEALTVLPLDTTCTIPPPAVLSVSPAGVACATVPNTVAAGSATGTTTIVVSNTAPTGSQDLRVTSVGIANPVNGTFTVTPLTATIPAGASANFTVSVDPTAPGPFTADVNLTTSAGNDTVCITGNGT
jgi:hypothetical protein